MNAPADARTAPSHPRAAPSSPRETHRRTTRPAPPPEAGTRPVGGLRASPRAAPARPRAVEREARAATPIGMRLSVRDVAKSYATADGPLRVLDGVSLDLRAGETLALTGESGSGKSTLLHLCAGLDAPDAGTIAIDGTDVAAATDAARAALRRGTVGLVFQQFNLIPSLDVRANLGFHARLAGRDADVDALAARLGLAAFLDRWPEQLSGGQQQRVAIGRTLAARPALVLADEPTGNLDEATGDAVLDLMVASAREAGAALLMVTHSDRLAARLDRRLHLRAGRVAPSGPAP